jgi:putative PIN family toxin of toxin-antitoxin system
MNATIVVDTSVIISALIGKAGPSREVLRRCLLGQYVPLISNSLFYEYEDVSMRSHILELCPLTQDEIRVLLNAYYSSCSWVSVYFLWRPNIPGEGDNFLVELALAGNAAHIVTNNIKDFHSCELVFDSLSVITPERLIRGE